MAAGSAPRGGCSPDTPPPRHWGAPCPAGGLQGCVGLGMEECMGSVGSGMPPKLEDGGVGGASILSCVRLAGEPLELPQPKISQKRRWKINWEPSACCEEEGLGSGAHHAQVLGHKTPTPPPAFTPIPLKIRVWGS